MTAARAFVALVALCALWQTAQAELFVRKNILHLSPHEQQEFIHAVNLLKNERNATGWSSYDSFVTEHSSHSEYAHRGPAFFPWHRQYLLHFESELRRVSGHQNLTIPYWDWINNDTRMDVWSEGIMGGNGTGSFSLIKNGPFANWTSTVDMNGTLIEMGIVRAWGTPLGDMPAMHHHMNNTVPPVLPDLEELLDSMRKPIYDTAPWNDASHDPPSFRNTFEGWEEWGCRLHNTVHLWVGGQMRTVMIAPNDPVFWLHHAFVDKVWDIWQHLHSDLPHGGFLPLEGARPGHNLNDIMPPFPVKIADVLSTRELGYTYEYDYLDQIIKSHL